MRTHILKLIINAIIIFFISLQGIKAINYRLTYLSTEEGISQQDVECIIQDKIGYIWIGTYDGLNRYDGNNITIFRHIPNDTMSISGNRIISLQEWSARDELWIGTEGGGLNCYNMRNQKFSHIYNNNTDGGNVISCLKLVGNDLWVGSAKGISKIAFTSHNKMTVTSFQLKGKLGEIALSQHILTIADDAQGNIIVGTSYGFYCKLANESTFYEIIGNKKIENIVKDKSDNLWVTTHTHIHFYSALQQKVKGYLSTPKVLPFNMQQLGDVRSILPITDQLVLINARKRLYWGRLSGNEFNIDEIQFSSNSFFQDNSIKMTMVDHSMNIWLTSSLDGVARFALNEKMINHYSHKKNTPKDKLSVQAIVKDKNKNLWVGSSAGCFVIDFENETTTRVEDINEQIFGLLKDQYNNIWGASFSNVYFFPDGDLRKKISILNHPQLPPSVSGGDGPYSFCEDKKNNIVWIGFRSGLLQVQNNGKQNDFVFNFFDRSLFGTTRLSNITQIFLDPTKNVLFVGTSNMGVFKVTLSENGNIIATEKVKHILNLKETNVWSIFQASNGIIYVGTDSGVKTLDTNKNGELLLQQISNNDYRLQTYKITSITEDDEKNIWLNTGSGLLSYNLESEAINEYLDTDGLSSRVLTEGMFYDSENKKLYVGSIKGLNIVELSSLRDNDTPPKTIINDIKVNNTAIYPNLQFNGRIILEESINYSKSIDLKYFENNITFDFASLHFNNPEKNQFAYKLEGFNTDWVYINNLHTATFTNLSSGKYILWVKSSNCDGVWENEPVKLQINISSAPWNTIWAYLLYCLILGVLIYFGYKYQSEKRKLQHKLLIEQFDSQKKIEIAEVKLKYHTNITHELRTPLSLIIAPVSELIDKSYNDDFLNSRLLTIKGNADRLIRLVNQFLDFRKVINDKYILRVKKQNLYNTLFDIKTGFDTAAIQKNISLEFFYDTNISFCWYDAEVLNKICYNLLSNAIKYTSEKGKVSIYASTNADNSTLYLSVEDNGIGIKESELDKIFDRFYQVPGSDGGTGIGLDLCRHFAEIHHGLIHVKSRLGEGSIFTVTLPIDKDSYEKELVEGPDLVAIDQKITPQTDELDEKQSKPLILLVEDNYELSSYIKSLLLDNATVILANNGEEGYRMAKAHVPDIIVSDIMMPVMDGIELVQKCKNDVITSHIPIILLTAKDGVDSEIEGLTYGADDYIRKPFNPHTLKLKIKNLIKLTRKEKSNEKEPISNLNERDRVFLDKFESVVLENISSPDFGIDDASRLMNLSRMQLYRKMTMLINQKPSQYIKEIKMKKAYELIKDKGYNITETMYEVGYTNYTHFSKLFIEINGESPRKIMGMKEKTQE